MKRLFIITYVWVLLFLGGGHLHAADDTSKMDRNQATTLIAVDNVSGEIRLIKCTPSGELLMSGSFSLSDSAVNELKNVWLTSGTVTLDTPIEIFENVFITSGTVKQETYSTIYSTGITINESTSVTFDARSSRRWVIVEASVENSSKIYISGTNTSVQGRGVELSAGQSISYDLYTGALYIQAESGATLQNARITELYE